jgi:hypothetical protein
MKIYIPVNWGWYVAVAVIFGPMVLIWTMEQNWMARLVSLLFFWGIIPIVILLWYSLGPSKNLVDIGKRRNIWPAYIIKIFGENGVDYLTRTLIFVAGLTYFMLAIFPLMKDMAFLLGNSVPIERTAYVAHTRSLSGNISEEVILETYPNTVDENDLTAWYFTPRHIMTGNTYTFLILPHSRIILEAIPVEIINR